MARRDATQKGEGEKGEGPYALSGPAGSVPASVVRWQDEVHRGKSYDVEVDTSRLSPGQCADVIRKFLEQNEAAAFSFERMASI
jgi:chloramphenicol 3-O phosphotransferase